MSPDKLVRMANQIAVFFASQPGSDQADRVAQHLRDYWDPRMRAELAALVADPASGLSDLAREGVARLERDAGDRSRVGARTGVTSSAG
jgi:formate dehydrogenase subunit delta